MAEKTFDKRQNTQSRLLSGTAKIVMYLFLIALVLLSIVPFYLVMVNATHSSFDIVTRLNLLPGASTLENYATMQSHVNIWRGFLNSLCIAVPYTAFTGYFGALAAFGFGKYRFKGRNVLFAVVLASMMIPSQLSMIGFYQPIIFEPINRMRT